MSSSEGQPCRPILQPDPQHLSFGCRPALNADQPGTCRVDLALLSVHEQPSRSLRVAVIVNVENRAKTLTLHESAQPLLQN